MFVGDPIVVETGNINVLAILEDSYNTYLFFHYDSERYISWFCMGYRQLLSC